MAKVLCKKCGSAAYVLNGFMQGKQRYLCRDCGYNFTATVRRGVHPGLKALAILLYASAGVTMARIAKIIGVSEVAVYKWVKAAGAAVPDPSSEAGAKSIVLIDEMWHYVEGKKTRFGSGKPMMLCNIRSSPGIGVGVLTAASKNS